MWIQRKTLLYNTPNFAKVFPWTKVRTVNEIWQPNSSIPSLEKKVIKIDPTATKRGGGWKERLGEITLDSIKEHVVLRGRISGRVLRTIRNLITKLAAKPQIFFYDSTYVRIRVFVCYRCTISNKTNARKRSEIGKMVEVEYKKGRRESGREWYEFLVLRGRENKIGRRETVDAQTNKWKQKYRVRV